MEPLGDEVSGRSRPRRVQRLHPELRRGARPQREDQRDALAAEIRNGLYQAQTGTKLSEHQINDWIVRADHLLAQAQALASS